MQTGSPQNRLTLLGILLAINLGFLAIPDEIKKSSFQGNTLYSVAFFMYSSYGLVLAGIFIISYLLWEGHNCLFVKSVPNKFWKLFDWLRYGFDLSIIILSLVAIISFGLVLGLQLAVLISGWFSQDYANVFFLIWFFLVCVVSGLYAMLISIPYVQKIFPFVESRKHLNMMNKEYNNREKIVRKQFSEQLSLCDEGMDVYLSLVSNIEYSLATDAIKSGKTLSGVPALKPLHLHRDSLYLFSSKELLESGQTQSGYSLLRSVFEDILLLYYLEICSSVDAHYFYLFEMHDKKHPALSPLQEKEIQKKYQYFSPKYFRNYLYSPAKCSQIADFYHGISKKSHPSINGLLGQIESRSDELNDALNLWLCLCAANILIAHSVFEDVLSSDTKKNDLAFLRKTIQKQCVADLAPNRAAYSISQLTRSLLEKAVA